MNDKKQNYTADELQQMIDEKIITATPETLEIIANDKKSGYVDLTTKENKDSKDSESKLQTDCFQWFNNTFPQYRGLLYHVPNGEKRAPVTANKLKAMGVVAGVPDLQFHFKSRTYFLELKKPNGSGVLSKNQKSVIKQLDTQRFMVWVFNDLETFKKLIENIINDKSEQFEVGLSKEDYFYKHKIFLYIYSLVDGQVVKIAEICEEQNQDKFFNCISEFMTEGFDRRANFELLFTPDYKAFYKRIEGSDIEIKYNGG